MSITNINLDEVFKNLNILSRELMILKSLKTFYQKKENYQLIISIVNGTNKLSRRLIEFFVTTYALNTKCVFKLNDNNKNVDVYASYKMQLRTYKKNYFDPFGRGIRIPYFFKDDCIITTTGQMNFYKWFISKNIYKYVIDNYEDIEQQLSSTKKNKKTNRKHKMNNRLIKNFKQKSIVKIKKSNSIVTFD
jgi:hypothetical protein